MKATAASLFVLDPGKGRERVRQFRQICSTIVLHVHMQTFVLVFITLCTDNRLLLNNERKILCIMISHTHLEMQLNESCRLSACFYVLHPGEGREGDKNVQT